MGKGYYYSASSPPPPPCAEASPSPDEGYYAKSEDAAKKEKGYYYSASSPPPPPCADLAAPSPEEGYYYSKSEGAEQKNHELPSPTQLVAAVSVFTVGIVAAVVGMMKLMRKESEQDFQELL